ncbi:MAG: TOBE domain-containing protein [Rhodocyclales bacterium]|nr:TOBE domain-containing protein [Rhodocyclales bacterium]
MKISARNAFKGKIKQLTMGAVNAEVIIALPGGLEIVSVITKHSAEAMKLAVGKDAFAVVKASDVMIGESHEPH